MTISIELGVDFAGLRLKNPVFTASGTCGYVDELADFMDINALGGFITKSITRRPRAGNPPARIVETDAGMLNAIGLANIGVDRFIEEKIPLIREFEVPIFVNIAGWAIDDYVETTALLAAHEEIAGFELNISCPNVKKGGITFGTDPELITKITQSVKKEVGARPLIVKLTPSVSDITVTARAAVEAGADALSLVNTFTAMVIDVESQQPVLANRTGGLSGPAIKPIAVYLVNRVYEAVGKPHSIPILGLGGIRTASDAVEFMLAGATAISVGTGTFMQPDSCLRVVEGLAEYGQKMGYRSISELTGALK